MQEPDEASLVQEMDQSGAHDADHDESAGGPLGVNAFEPRAQSGLRGGKLGRILPDAPGNYSAICICIM
jgi:hypothetical protein